MRPALHFVLYSVGLASPETQTTEEERDCITKYARGKKRAAEIGSWHGVTTARIAEAIAADGTVFAVDPYATGRLRISFPQKVARSVTRKWNDRIQWLRTTGVAAAADFAKTGSDPFDFVFIDGDHSYEGLRGDWESWFPLIAPGGFVALHDSRSTPDRNHEKSGSCIYTREVILKDGRFELVEEVDTLSVLRRLAV